MAVDLSRIAARIRERNERERARIESKKADAMVEVERLRREFMRIDPTIRKIVLFGSLAEDRVTRIDFDIDLAVSSDRYLSLVSASLDSTFPVDCVDIDALPPGYRAGIERYGRVLHEA
jgi:predicted nucleotidyltransferase